MRASSLIALALAACASAVHAAIPLWEGLDEDAWYCGRRIAAADLVGKVVLVGEFSTAPDAERDMLKRLQAVWAAFKSKPFVLLASHQDGRNADAVDALVREFSLGFPIYDRAGLAGAPANDDKLPFLYVVDVAGKVVYSGREDREATEAVVEALGNASKPLGRDAALEEIKALEATRPAAAMMRAAAFRRKWPRDAKMVDDLWQRYSSDRTVAKVAKARKVANQYRDWTARNLAQTKKALAALKAAKLEIDPVAAAEGPARAEAKSVVEELREIHRDLALAAVQEHEEKHRKPAKGAKSAKR